ncbi:MAG: type I phosphomannose isomerase catalytic subunit [Bacteroidales bacterium]
MYPLKFEPILKSLIWGGDKIASFKNVETDQKNIGESWEVSQVEGNVSVVSNGPDKGKDLADLIHEHKAELLGTKVYARFGEMFPLLIKFIDARDNLSIQVHPDDELAKKRHNSFGKTEMWYVMDAEKDAKILCGFSKQIDAAEYVSRVNNNTIMDVIQSYEAKEGQVFYLPAGRIHAIGAGSFIAEIQQTSNITYRIYDYDRRDKDGNARELHTELAKDALDYTVYPSYLSEYEKQDDTANQIVTSPYFTTNYLPITSEIKRNHLASDSFVIYICMKGKAVLTDANGFKVTISKGESVLVPASVADITISPEEPTELLETYIG